MPRHHVKLSNAPAAIALARRMMADVDDLVATARAMRDPLYRTILPGSSASVLQAPRDPVDGGEEGITQRTIGSPLIAPAAEQVDLENVHRVHVGIP